MGRISPFVKLLRGEYELTIILLLTRLRGKARADEIIKAGKKTKTLPALNGARVAGARKFLVKNELIEIEKDGHEIIHILTKKGRKLGKLLNSVSDFIIKDLKWKW
jgi:predicted transcriptional regulator